MRSLRVRWAERIQTHITDEQEKVHAWIAGMTEDLLRMKRLQHAQPHWAQPMLNPCQPAPLACPRDPLQPLSSSPASMVPVKPAPMTRNPSMASAPQGSQSSSSMGRPVGGSKDEATAPVTTSMAQSEQMLPFHVQREQRNSLRHALDETNFVSFLGALIPQCPRRRSVKECMTLISY